MLILPHLLSFSIAIVGTVPLIKVPALLYVIENRWKKSVLYK